MDNNFSFLKFIKEWAIGKCIIVCGVVILIIISIKDCSLTDTAIELIIYGMFFELVQLFHDRLNDNQCMKTKDTSINDDQGRKTTTINEKEERYDKKMPLFKHYARLMYFSFVLLILSILYFRVLVKIFKW